MSQRVLGLDLGTSFGWALLQTDPLLVVSAGVFDLRIKAREGPGTRPYKLRQELTSLLIRHNPHVVVYEDVKNHSSARKGGGRSFNIYAAHYYGELRGVVREVCDMWRAHDAVMTLDEFINKVTPIPYTCIGVGAWKKAAVGKGNASKEQVAEAMRLLPGFPEGRLPHDVTDAAGIAYGWSLLNLGVR